MNLDHGDHDPSSRYKFDVAKAMAWIGLVLVHMLMSLTKTLTSVLGNHAGAIGVGKQGFELGSPFKR